MSSWETVVMFGGSGFIGTHLAQHFMREKSVGKVILADILPPRNAPYSSELHEGLRSGLVEFVHVDVRAPITASKLPSRADLIINLAAILRDPGYRPEEYFETNLYGAENVCAYASWINCSRVVFTSSVSTYGPSEELMDESSLPVPETPYGSSKLVAEKIHLAWQSAKTERKLVILRPGVVFGPGEDGNVTRLIRSIVRGYFVYVGNQATRKAGGYVKELCSVLQFALEHQDRTGEALTLLNFSVDPVPRLDEFVDTIRNVAKIRRSPYSIPRSALLGVSYPVDIIARAFRIKQPVCPVRVRKLYRSTSIDPKRLRELGYRWQYTLNEAFQDWRKELPGDFSTDRR